jgi:hypothetical protein
VLFSNVDINIPVANCPRGKKTPSFGARELQPRHDFQLREQSPPPSYSPPQYSPSPPPSYSSTVLHNTVAQT